MDLETEEEEEEEEGAVDEGGDAVADKLDAEEHSNAEMTRRRRTVRKY